MKKIIRLTESDLTRLVRRVIRETNSSPKRRKQMNESFLGVLAVGALALGASGLYTNAKRMWSKHITGRKYKPTGVSEIVHNQEKDKDITIKQYKDKDGNLYWGWDHLWNPDPMIDSGPGYSDDLYRAIFKEKDENKLKKFLRGEKVKTIMGSHGSIMKHSPEYDYLDKPEPVDMIFLKDFDDERYEHGNI